jgi:hypothetical protein
VHSWRTLKFGPSVRSRVLMFAAEPRVPACLKVWQPAQRSLKSCAGRYSDVSLLETSIFCSPQAANVTEAASAAAARVIDFGRRVMRSGTIRKNPAAMPLHTPSGRGKRPRPALPGALARTVATVLTALLLLTAAFAAGCGSPAPVDVAESQPIAIAMSEFRLTPQTVRLNGAGRRTFEIRNEGTMVHRFELRSADGTKRVVIGAPLKPGQSETLTVKLARGRYLMRCAQERHNTLGEHGELVVG